MNAIPIIDISPLAQGDESARQSVVTGIDTACHEIGFMIVRGHGIPAATISQVREIVAGFFARPIEEKLELSITRENYRGYIPLDFFTPNAAGVIPDRYEGYKLHFETDVADPICSECSLYGSNKWPERPPNMRDAVLEYWQHCDHIAAVLLTAIAAAIGIDPRRFSSVFEKPLTNMTLLHYPPKKRGADAFGIHPHKDTDALTILAPDPVGGLQVRPIGQQEWIDVNAPEDALIVNIGDMLEVWSGGYFVSTPHRVINNTGSERFSFPYFAVPRHDVVVAPLVEPQPDFVERRIAVGDVSRDIWQSNWPDAAPIDSVHDPATP